MADIKVSNGERAVANIYEDDEGYQFWACACGQHSEHEGNMADTIADAVVHVDHQCRYRD